LNYPPELYAAVHDGTEGDIEFYRQQCRGATSVLELACGYGRVLEALKDEVDDLVGLDIDPELLAIARRRVPTVELVEGDIREFNLGRTFERILLPHTSLYCLLSEDDVVRCLTMVARHLAPEGRLVLDAYDADDFHQRTRPEDLDETSLIPVKQVEADGRGWMVLERSSWDRPMQRIDATYVHVAEDGETVEATIAQRYVLSDQLPQLLDHAGLRLVEQSVRFGPRSDGGVWAATAVLKEPGDS
jgi:SAM-dependent methyltransferase